MIGLATLDLLVNEKMAEQAVEKGAHLKKHLKALQEEYECIGDVRGRGLLLGIEIVKDRENKIPDPELGSAISDRCLELGLSMNIVRIKGYGGVFRIAPPMTISMEELDLGISILKQAIKDCVRK